MLNNTYIACGRRSMHSSLHSNEVCSGVDGDKAPSAIVVRLHVRGINVVILTPEMARTVGV